jgi:ureidoglycolate lyase
MKIIASPLTAEAFAPFGEVIERPAAPGRQYYDAALGNGRPQAPGSLSMVQRPPIEGLPFEARMMERHEFSSQTFIPIDAGRWVVVVCPHHPDGGPDVAGLRAFIASPQQGVTYRMNTWHHGLTVLDQPATMAVFMWRDGTSGDEEFVDVPPFTVSES